jgi:hypothetical protein
MISIKGGWLNRIPIWDKWEQSRSAIIEDKNTPWFKWFFVKIGDWFLDGTQISAFIFTFIMAAIQPDLTVALLSGFVWWLWVMSSMGEEAGGVGDTTEAWGEYIDFGFGRKYALKKAASHGFAGGALVALVTGWVWFIPAFASFPVVYFLGNTLNRKIMKERGWAISELLYDVVILAALGMYWNGH